MYASVSESGVSSSIHQFGAADREVDPCRSSNLSSSASSGKWEMWESMPSRRPSHGSVKSSLPSSDQLGGGHWPSSEGWERREVPFPVEWTPAEQPGLRKRDYLLAVDGPNPRDLTSSDDFILPADNLLPDRARGKSLNVDQRNNRPVAYESPSIHPRRTTAPPPLDDDEERQHIRMQSVLDVALDDHVVAPAHGDDDAAALSNFSPSPQHSATSIHSSSMDTRCGTANPGSPTSLYSRQSERPTKLEGGRHWRNHLETATREAEILASMRSMDINSHAQLESEITNIPYQTDFPKIDLRQSDGNSRNELLESWPRYEPDYLRHLDSHSTMSPNYPINSAPYFAEQRVGNAKLSTNDYFDPQSSRSFNLPVTAQIFTPNTQYTVDSQAQPPLLQNPIGLHQDALPINVETQRSQYIPNQSLYTDSHTSQATSSIFGPSRYIIPPNSHKYGNNTYTSRSTTLLDEVRNAKTYHVTLGGILGHAVEFSSDQHGSRFLQNKLETASENEMKSVFSELLPNTLTLTTDVFGNYVVQKLFEFGNESQRSQLGDQLTGHVLPLSLQMYGCRVVQKALEYVNLEQQVGLVKELKNAVLECVKDQNGNHVIQKAIEHIPMEHVRFITDAFHGRTFELACHPYGCRVIQRVLENPSYTRDLFLNELHPAMSTLILDQYGNYVVQHVIECGQSEDKAKIQSIVRVNFVQFSKHKFASNVVEKCIIHGDPAQRQLFVDDIISPDGDSFVLLSLMKDSYGVILSQMILHVSDNKNYVVQKLLSEVDGIVREKLVASIKPHLQPSKKIHSGKHFASIERSIGMLTTSLPPNYNKRFAPKKGISPKLR